MGFYGERVLPRLVDLTCGTKGIDRWRAKATEGLVGRVVEIGFGSGLNAPHYPAEVTSVVAVEPSSRAVDLAAGRLATCRVPVERVGLDGQRLDLDDASADSALSTFTLCTIPDATAALLEIARVLVPGGRLHLLEHGLAPDEGVVRWQRRLDPIQQRMAGGCHLTRDLPALLCDAGYTDLQLTHRYVKGPRPWCYFTWGSATPAS